MIKASFLSLLLLLGFASARETIRGRRELQTEQTLGYIAINGDPVTFEVPEGDPVFYGYINECLLSGNIPEGTKVTCELTECTEVRDSDIVPMVIGLAATSQGANLTDLTYSNSTEGCPVSIDYTFETEGAGGVIAIVTGNGDITDVTMSCTSENWPEETTCFSGETTVDVQGKGSLQMKDVQINDQVFVGADSNSKPIYQPVYAFGHDNKDSPSTFLQIHTAPQSGEPLEISAPHLLYVDGKSNPVRADSLKVGDKLIQESAHSSAKSVEVTKINMVVRNGAYMPLTKDGPIIVNGIKASSYVSIAKDAPAVVDMFSTVFSEDQLLHWWLAPYRMVCQGVPSLCENDKNTEGISHWLMFGKSLAQMANGWGVVGQMVGISFVGLAMAFFMGLEAMTLPGVVSAVAMAGFAKKMMDTKNGEMVKKID